MSTIEQKKHTALKLDIPKLGYAWIKRACNELDVLLVVVEEAAPSIVLRLLLLTARRGPDGTEAEVVVRQRLRLLRTSRLTVRAFALVTEACRVENS